MMHLFIVIKAYILISAVFFLFSINTILFDKTIETDGKITKNKLIKAQQLAITIGEYTI